jgi:hypothetical protein
MKKIVGWIAMGFLCVFAAAQVSVPAAQESPNLALNKSVRVSSTFDQSSWSQDFVVDGIRTEKAGARGWSSQGDTSVNHTEWIRIDLGTNYHINRVDLYPRNDSRREGESFPIDFTIQTSLDANNWTTVVSRTGYGKPGPEAQKFTFDRTVARWVKIEGTNLRYLGAESAYYMQFTEIEVYGPGSGGGGGGGGGEPDKSIPLAPSSWSGQVAMDGGERHKLTVAIGGDNKITGQILLPRGGGMNVNFPVTGSYDPGTGAFTMQYAVKSGFSVTEGTLTGKAESNTAASGTATVTVSLRQVNRVTSTKNGSWRLTRQ